MSKKEIIDPQLMTVNESHDRERVQQWRAHHAVEVTGVRYKVKDHSTSTNNSINIESHINDKFTRDEKAELHAASMWAATGSASLQYSAMLLTGTMNVLNHNKQYDTTFIANATNDALISLKPQDPIEGMLCSRMISLHSSYMNFMNIASNPNTPEQLVDANINRATKLMRLYNETLESLNRHRRKGEQKVTVQHINVTNHGQAIVANEVSTQGGGQ